MKIFSLFIIFLMSFNTFAEVTSTGTGQSTEDYDYSSDCVYHNGLLFLVGENNDLHLTQVAATNADGTNVRIIVNGCTPNSMVGVMDRQVAIDDILREVVGEVELRNSRTAVEVAYVGLEQRKLAHGQVGALQGYCPQNYKAGINKCIYDRSNSETAADRLSAPNPQFDNFQDLYNYLESQSTGKKTSSCPTGYRVCGTGCCPA